MPTKRRAQILGLLVEGVSLRAASRLAADALEELCAYLGLPKASIPTQPDEDLVALLRERAGSSRESEGQQ